MSQAGGGRHVLQRQLRQRLLHWRLQRQGATSSHELLTFAACRVVRSAPGPAGRLETGSGHCRLHNRLVQLSPPHCQL